MFSVRKIAIFLDFRSKFRIHQCANNQTSYHHHDRTTKKPVVFEILGGNNTEFHLCFLTFYLLPGHLENQKLQFSIRERDVEAVKADCDIPALLDSKFSLARGSDEECCLRKRFSEPSKSLLKRESPSLLHCGRLGLMNKEVHMMMPYTEIRNKYELSGEKILFRCERACDGNKQHT